MHAATPQVELQRMHDADPHRLHRLFERGEGILAIEVRLGELGMEMLGHRVVARDGFEGVSVGIGAHPPKCFRRPRRVEQDEGVHPLRRALRRVHPGHITSVPPIRHLGADKALPRLEKSVVLAAIQWIQPRVRRGRDRQGARSAAHGAKDRPIPRFQSRRLAWFRFRQRRRVAGLEGAGPILVGYRGEIGEQQAVIEVSHPRPVHAHRGLQLDQRAAVEKAAGQVPGVRPHHQCRKNHLQPVGAFAHHADRVPLYYG